MKLLSAKQFKELDHKTIVNESIASIELMERAAKVCADWILENCRQQHFIIICGTGNNGADGLAISRLLSESKKKCTVMIVGQPKDGAIDFKTNLERLKLTNVQLAALSDKSALSHQLNESAAIVDAIFGTGLNRPPDSDITELIKTINALPNLKLSVDIPSGLPADFDAPFNGTAVKADFTLTFHLPKTSFLFEKTGNHTGRVIVLDIGLDKSVHQNLKSEWQMTDSSSIQRLLPRPSNFDHKGSNGSVAIIAGNDQMPGAAALAARGALHSGVGLVHLFGPSDSGIDPEVIRHTNTFDSIENNRISAFGIGPGLGTEEQATNLVDRCLDFRLTPSVWDADALNIIAANQWQNRLVPGSILTPHPKEFDRLFGKSTNDIDRLSVLRSVAAELQVNIVLKGAYTRIASANGSIHFNASGNAAMAKGGMGDVLTGLIAGLLAKGMKPPEAALAGVYLHGLAGDLADDEQGPEGVTASVVASALPRVFAKVRMGN